jgi:SPP1 gp7 family putative phage head morphogenesis protein
MSILDIFRGKQRAINDRGGLSRVWSQAPRSETTRLPNLFHQTPRLDPVDLIASTIAAAPIELFDKKQFQRDRENAEPVLDHPFYELMDSPSRMFPELDGYALKYVTAILCELLGECFWIKFRSGRKIDEILVMPPAWCIMTPTASNATFLFQPFGTTAGKMLSIAPEDVVWFKQPDITDPYGRGRGRTETLGDELDADEMAAKWQKNYFYNDATPPFWANIPGAQQSDLERMRDTWGQRLGGWMNARKPAFTNSDNIQIQKLGDTVKEMDFTESRKYLRDGFLQHYSIPPELFGILENSNRSTIDAAYYLFSKNVITRRLGFYERAITKQLIAPDYDARLIAKIDFEIPEDEAFKLQKVSAGLTSGALTRADWKRAMGYKPEKGDEVYLVPYSLLEVPKGTTVQDAKPEPVAPVAPPDAIELPESEEEPQDKAYKGLDARKAAHWKASDNRAKQGEGMFRTRTRAYAEVQADRVKKAIAGKAPNDYKAAIDDAFKGADDALMHAYAPAWIASMTDGAEIGRGYLGLKASPSFSLYNKLFDKWVKSFGLIKAKEINTTTYDELRAKMDATLAEGIAAGESIPNLSKRLLEATDGVYDNMSQYRADMIARTETMGSVNFGQQVVYESEGVEEKEFIATQDEDTREDHLAANGQVVKINEAFDVGGEALMYPGDPSGSAGNVINCRCTILPVVKL